MYKLRKFLIILVLIPVTQACVTTKKRDETSKLGKVFHDITSKYNRNFNANVLIDETMLQLETSLKEDYSQLLPVYPLVDKENPTSLAEPMNKAIEKASVAISIHRPSHWTDDNYMIIGRAQYIKEDYESAEATFRYIVKHYDPHNLIAASSPKSRNVNQKISDKEKAQEKKEAEKEREEKVKNRKKEIAQKQKAQKKKAKQAQLARVKARKQQIKERERLARTSGPPPSATKNPDKDRPVVANETKEEPKKGKKPFDENPKLPKVKGNPDTYFMKHKPAHQEAQLWLAKTLIERDRFGEADNILRSLDNETNTFKEIKEEIYPVLAHSALSRGQIASAADPLTKAIEISNNRQLKARYSFILAQIQEQTGLYQNAVEAYDQVVKLKPDYEMSFNAQLRRLKLDWNIGTLNEEKFTTEIKRMIRDSKNSEYQDQLFYTLAQKDLKKGDKMEAIANLSEAIRKSAGNLIQKAECYYILADLFYKDENYVKAKYYFDSTLTVMSKEDLRYPEVSQYSKNLSKIASNLEIIELQDSLIELGKLPEKELRALALQIKKEQEKAEASAKAASQTSKPASNLSAINTPTQNTALGQSGAASLFFAYDDRELKKGVRDFSRTWGDISLQDNWRRSSSTVFAASDSEESSDTATASGAITDTELDEIFKNVPRTPEQVQASEAKIEEALFKLGQLFRSELSNIEKSNESLEKLMERFPDTENELDAYYLLYVNYTELKQLEKAEYYSSKILNEHADSEYAKYIKDPGYLQNVQSDEEKVEEYYKQVYALYEKGQFESALKELVQSRTNLPSKHALQSKFSFLSALCIGRLQGREPYVNALKETIAKYPNTEEEVRAKEIIRLLGIRFTETQEGIEEINEDSYFTLTAEDKLHMILVAMRTDASGDDRNKARVSISDYNKKYHNLDKLNVSMILLGEKNDLPLLVIRRFDSREQAMAYFEGVQKNANEFMGDPSRYEVFAASQTNYRKIVQLKSVDLYRSFFVKEYLSK